MLLSLATIAVTFAPAVPQDPQQSEPLLSSSDHKSINKKVKDYFEKSAEYDAAESHRARSRLGKRMRTARTNFEKDWDRLERKVSKDGELLASLPDLQAIFEDPFPYDRGVRGTGEYKTETGESTSDTKVKWGMVLPRTYRSDEGIPTVICIADWNTETNTWSNPKDHYEKTWNDTEFGEEAAIVLPVVDDEIELDRIPDFEKSGELENEARRINAVLGTAGVVQRSVNFDRSHLIIDAGKGSAGFGLRLATYFPARFAGVILRDVPTVDDLRLGSLTGMPVMIAAEDQEGAKALAAKLNALQEGETCKVVAADAKAEVASWAKGLRRELNRHHIVIEPNHDSFRKGYWIAIGTCESLLQVGKDDRPRLEATVDRENNTITITTKSITDFMLLLNDEIVDLDKEFTVILNGSMIKDTRQRNRSRMIELMQRRFDGDYIFTTDYKTSVPKSPPAPGK